jgi:hypothetical protein
LPGFSGTTNLSATPGRPAYPSRVSGWSSLTSPWGFPCCVRFPCVHAVATTPAQRLGVLLRSFTQPYQPSPITLSGRPAHCPFRGLLGVHSRYGLHTRAVTVYRDTLSEGFSHFVTSMTAPVASGWSGCRVGLGTHWKAPPFHGARVKQTSLSIDGNNAIDPNRSLAVRPERPRLHRASASVHRLNGEASVPIHLHVLDEGATADLFAQLDPVLAGGSEVDAGVDPRVGVLLGSLREAAE